MADRLYALTADQVRKINADRSLLRAIADGSPAPASIAVNVAKAVYVASLVKTADGFYPATIYASADDDVGEAVLLSYAGPIDGIGTEVLAVRTGYGADGRVLFESPYNGPLNAFPAQLTDVLPLTGVTGFSYAWNEWEYTSMFTVAVKAAGRVGLLRAHGVLVHIQTADGLNPDIWTLSIDEAESGIYKLTLDGTPVTTAYTAAPVLSGMTVATVSSDNYLITSNDGTAHTLGLDDSGLRPANPSNPGITLNQAKLGMSQIVHLSAAGGAPAVCEMSPTVTGNPLGNASATPPTPPVAQQFALTIRNVIEGTYTITFTNAKTSVTLAPSPPISFSAAIADVQTALSTVLACTVGGAYPDYTITVTKDNNPYTAAVDKTKLRSTQSFVVLSGFGDACTGPLGGIDPTSIAGWTGPPVPTIAILPTGSSVGPWTLTITNATGGNYDIVFDGGSPVGKAWNAAPVLTGITVSVIGTTTWLLTGDGTTSHTILAYGGRLRSSDPDYGVTVSGGCAKLEPIGDC